MHRAQNASLVNGAEIQHQLKSPVRLLFVRVWREPESRGRWTGDEDRARANQVLPLEGTVKESTGCAREGFDGTSATAAFAITRLSETQRTYVLLRSLSR
jgi:hypothetical protein